jgi:hypothetical protein
VKAETVPVRTAELDQANQEAARNAIREMARGGVRPIHPSYQHVRPATPEEIEASKPKIYRVKTAIPAPGGSRILHQAGKILDERHYDVPGLMRTYPGHIEPYRE